MGDPLRSVAADFSLLPKDRAFRDLLPAFLLPYLAYVAIPGLLGGLLGPDLAQAARLVVVGGLLLRFRKSYAFGPRLALPQALAGLAVAALANVLWVVYLRGLLAQPAFAGRLSAAEGQDFSLLYAALRAANSVLLVPLFEELFCRVWVQELAHPGPGRPGAPAPQDREPRPLDRRPRPLPAPPLSARAVAAATAVFALGHDAPSILPAILYFLLTTAVYARTRSFRACVLVHALTNLAIAMAVMLRPDLRFLWF